MQVNEKHGNRERNQGTYAVYSVCRALLPPPWYYYLAVRMCSRGPEQDVTQDQREKEWYKHKEWSEQDTEAATKIQVPQQACIAHPA